MTFDQLLEEVYVLTARRDLTAETVSAVKSATLKAHNLDFFSKDLYETGVKWENKEYKQYLDYISIVSNYRAIKYIKRVEDASDEIGTEFSIITPEEVLDSYGAMKSDIAYVAGRVIHIRSCVPFDRVLFSCYVSPVVTTGAYSSWIADLYPFAIVYEAARLIFKAIGQDQKVAYFTQMVLEEYTILKANSIQDIGY